jgi:hypothetical protein
MPTNENKLKVRMVRTPRYEDESIFIIMDRLPPFSVVNHSYFLGCKLYNTNLGIERSTRNGEKIDSDLMLRGNGHDPVNRSREDVYELPTIREYSRFMELLKKNGYVWNKKKDTLTKDGRLVG